MSTKPVQKPVQKPERKPEQKPVQVAAVKDRAASAEAVQPAARDGSDNTQKSDPAQKSAPAQKSDPKPAPKPAAKPASGAASAAAKAAPGAPPKPEPKPEPKPVPPIRPTVSPAALKRRHFGIMASFVAVVVVPFLLSVGYLYLIAQDQYASTAGFTIRTEETGSASALMGGIGTLLGGPTSSNAPVLNAFIQSQDIVQRVHDRLDLTSHYARDWPADPLFTLWPGAMIEDLVWFWQRMVRVHHDSATGLMEIEVRARNPEMAREIASAIIAESEAMINALNEQARRDTMASAERDVVAALERLREAREALTSFRARTQIVDPAADIQGRMGVINNLQQQLAQALVDHDLLLTTTPETDPRVRQAQRRIDVINERIAEERLNFATRDVTVFDTEYPRLISQFESLRVDQEFAEQTYRAALTALDAARSNADRQSLFLATFIRPTLAQRAEYPERLLLSFLMLGFLTMIWAVMALVYYSLRDRG